MTVVQSFLKSNFVGDGHKKHRHIKAHYSDNGNSYIDQSSNAGSCNNDCTNEIAMHRTLDTYVMSDHELAGIDDQLTEAGGSEGKYYI